MKIQLDDYLRDYMTNNNHKNILIAPMMCNT